MGRKRKEPRPKRGGYADQEVTKAPDWHGLVAWDLLLNNLATGTFLVAAIGELAAPSALAAPARLAYPLALAFLTADLACLVLDLGDPLRFHHMLRVFKMRSPMSLGTWCLTVFSLPLSLIVAIDLADRIGLLPRLRTLHLFLLVAGLLPALGSAAYKGVLFSTSSQPAWKDARWLGGYLVNSAFLLGCGVLLAIAALMGDAPAPPLLLPAFRALLVLNLVPLALLARELRPGATKVGAGGALQKAAALAAIGGAALPIGLSFAPGGPYPLVGAVVLALAGNFAFRSMLVKLPHLAHDHH